MQMVKDGNIYKAVKEERTEIVPNVTVVGSPTINNGVVSGFSTSNYASLPTNVSLGNDFEIMVKAVTGNDATSEQKLMMGRGEQYLGLGIRSTGVLDCNIGDGTQWLNPITTSIALTPNTVYWFKIIFNGSRYSFFYSTDGVTFIECAYLESSTIIPNNLLRFGVGRSENAPWLGSIDLNESYIKINGETWWTGMREEVKYTYKGVK